MGAGANTWRRLGTGMGSVQFVETVRNETLEGTPACGMRLRQLVTTLESVDCSVREFIRVVERHPALGVRMLQIVNSGHFGLGRSLDSVKVALAFIGFNTLKNVALTLITSEEAHHPWRLHRAHLTRDPQSRHSPDASRSARAGAPSRAKMRHGFGDQKTA